MIKQTALLVADLFILIFLLSLCRSNQDIRADECAVGIAQMTVKEGRQLSIVAEADELDSSNGSTEQHVSTVLDAEHGSKSWTPNLIDVERENRSWVRGTSSVHVGRRIWRDRPHVSTMFNEMWSVVLNGDSWYGVCGRKSIGEKEGDEVNNFPCNGSVK